MKSDKDLDAHFRIVCGVLRFGLLVPFFGAGVNLCGRDSDFKIEYLKKSPKKYLPSGPELARFLAEEYSFPDENVDLARVSQYAEMMGGTELLRRRLHELFVTECDPTAVHKFFAKLPKELGKPQLIITTNYDDLMERAFTQARTPYDTVTYIAEGKNRGKFVYWPYRGRPSIIHKPNEFLPPLESRSIILKIHGAVRQSNRKFESFVITEDHYISYPNQLPAKIMAKLKGSQFLFLGYALRDWNLRVIFHRIWGEQKRFSSTPSWAVQLQPNELEQKLWERHEVSILHSNLENYMKKLEKTFAACP